MDFLVGILIHGPSGCGKTSLARWLAQEGKGHFKFLSVACADLVHKVGQQSSVSCHCDLLKYHHIIIRSIILFLTARVLPLVLLLFLIPEFL
jgi:replication-associated recombination protein RarA